MDDNQIIALFFQRNEDAIRQTDSVYGSRLFRISQNILRCQEDAQECVSDTYLRAWNAIPPHPSQQLVRFSGPGMPEFVPDQAGLGHGVKTESRNRSLDPGDGAVHSRQPPG